MSKYLYPRVTNTLLLLDAAKLHVSQLPDNTIITYVTKNNGKCEHIFKKIFIIHIILIIE